MSDDSFGHDFVWYEWSFVAPEDLPREDLDVKRDAFEPSRTRQSPWVQERSDVWHKRR